MAAPRKQREWFAKLLEDVAEALRDDCKADYYRRAFQDGAEYHEVSMELVDGKFYMDFYQTPEQIEEAFWRDGER